MKLSEIYNPARVYNPVSLKRLGIGVSKDYLVQHVTNDWNNWLESKQALSIISAEPVVLSDAQATSIMNIYQSNFRQKAYEKEKKYWFSEDQDLDEQLIEDILDEARRGISPLRNIRMAKTLQTRNLAKKYGAQIPVSANKQRNNSNTFGQPGTGQPGTGQTGQQSTATGSGTGQQSTGQTGTGQQSTGTGAGTGSQGVGQGGGANTQSAGTNTNSSGSNAMGHTVNSIMSSTATSGSQNSTGLGPQGGAQSTGKLLLTFFNFIAMQFRKSGIQPYWISKLRTADIIAANSLTNTIIEEYNNSTNKNSYKPSRPVKSYAKDIIENLAIMALSHKMFLIVE